MKIKDLSNMRFGRIVAIRPTDKRKRRNVVWECKCDCGNTHYVSSEYLTPGSYHSCGCLFDEMRKSEKEKRKNLIGKRYGKLVVVDVAGSARNGKDILYLCKCDCGNETIRRKQELMSNTRSCGCIAKENRIKNVTSKPYDTQEPKTRLSLLTQKISIRNTTGVKGVTKHKNGKFQAYITLKGKRKSLGLFRTIDDAAKARKDAEKKYFEPILKKYGYASKDGADMLAESEGRSDE